MVDTLRNAMIYKAGFRPISPWEGGDGKEIKKNDAAAVV
jgi:hypothetical protein